MYQRVEPKFQKKAKTEISSKKSQEILPIRLPNVKVQGSSTYSSLLSKHRCIWENGNTIPKTT